MVPLSGDGMGGVAGVRRRGWEVWSGSGDGGGRCGRREVWPGSGDGGAWEVWPRIGSHVPPAN